MTVPGDQAKLVELIGDIPIAMLTTYGGAGVRSVPMARQEVEPDAEMWFIAARDTKHVADIQVEPRVSLTFSSRSSWVALTGTAAVVDDEARLKELWNTFAQAWLPGGPEDPNAVLIKVVVEEAEYWDTPGGNVASLISFAKTKLTGDTFDTDHGVVHP
jgi:general stress protein 26